MCIEAYTVKVNKGLLTNADKNINDLKEKLVGIERNSTAKFNEEYNMLLKTLAGKNFDRTAGEE